MIAVIIFLATLWLILFRQLSGEWSVNEQYNYGWFVPFFALFLFWLRWEDRPRAQFPISNFQFPILAAVAICCLLLLFPIRLFEIANPDWRPLDWIHAVSVVTLTLLGLWFAGGMPWLRHFAFPVAFFLVAVPWVTPIEVPIIQGLMRMVAAVAAETVALFGIPAQLQGSLIRVSSGLVGVDEACSGVRSLQTSLMIGLLFGELKRLSILRRILLVAGAIAIALGANLCRAIFLVWIAASKNVAAIKPWHDLAGYTIVGLVVIGSIALAALLGRTKLESRKAKVENEAEDREQRSEISLLRAKAATATVRSQSSGFLISNFYLLLSAAAIIWLLLIEIGAAAWYRAHERNLVASARWEIQWPHGAPSFRELKIDEDVRRILRFDQGRAATWIWPALDSSGPLKLLRPTTITCSLFFFRWNAGKNSALLANLHRPDVCLPAVGWKQVADTGVRNYPVTASFALPFRHFEFRHGAPGDPGQQVAHAFYCLWEDRAATPSAAASKLPQMENPASTWTRSERIRAVMEGRRHLGQQVMEFVMQTRGLMDVDQIDARFATLVPTVIKVESDQSRK
jgi:exosortase